MNGNTPADCDVVDTNVKHQILSNQDGVVVAGTYRPKKISRGFADLWGMGRLRSLFRG